MSVESTPTQQGGDIPEFTPASSGRNQAMAEIAKKAHAEVAPDLSDFDETTGQIGAAQAPPEQNEPEAASAQQEQDAPEAKPEPTKVEPPAPKMVSIVVDGRPIEVPEDKILEAGRRTLQKESAADRRLQEAADKERQAEALLQHARRASGMDPAVHQQAPSQDAHNPNTQTATQGLDPEALDKFLEQKLYMRDAQKAAAKFEKDFPEIASDPYLRNIAASIEQKRLDTAAVLGEPFGDPFDAYQKAGEQVREWLKQRTPAATPGASIPADKREMKRSITAVPSASATAPKPKEDKPKSVPEQIEAMRQARLSGRPIPIHPRSH